MIDRININGVTYSATPLEAGAQATGITITVDGVTYLLGDVIAPMKEQAASTEASGNIDKISVNGVVYDIRDVEDVAAERKRAMEAENRISSIFSDELGREADARMYADNTTRSMGVLFGGFSNRQTTADEVVIGYKSIDQEHEGAFSIPAATTTSAGVMTAKDKLKLNASIKNIEVSPDADEVELDLEVTDNMYHVPFPAATTESAGVMSAADKKKLDSLSPGGGGGGGVAELMVEVTYSELVALRDNANLVAGMKYRITDYVTTTIQYHTKSANHPFDIIVEAVSENELSELARAIQHEGDTYFDGNDLGAWQLWYDLDNNTDKYEWADAENGKGVIYRMIDEKRNDCPYDFKNILFYASSYGGDNATLDRYYYTFSYVSGLMSYDGTVEKRVTHCHNNSMEVYAKSGKSRLNGNVFIIKYSSSYCIYNTFGTDCELNTFEEDCYSNTFGRNCSYNIFRKRCYSNTFNDHCEYNMFGNDCNYNTFGNYCNYNTFGDNCGHNTFGNYCSRNDFENTSDRKLDVNRTSITLNEEYYDDGTNALVPIKHPDLSTQPSILPYKFMGQYVYEQLLVTNPEDFTLKVNIYNTLAVNKPLIISIDAISTSFSSFLSWSINDNILRVDKDGGETMKTIPFLKIVYTSMPEEGDYYGYNNY